MDLMGSDALQSEEAMRSMWCDSIKAIQCNSARIGYEDFLLLMKGQSKEVPATEMELGPQNRARLAGISELHVVDELVEEEDGAAKQTTKENDGVIEPPSEDAVSPDGAINPSGSIEATTPAEMDAPSSPMTSKPITPEDSETPPTPKISRPHSAPATPVDHKRVLDLDGESPLWPENVSKHTVVDDLVCPGVPGSAASLTPPQSPVRGAKDYITPGAARSVPNFGDVPSGSSKLILPELPSKVTRQRSQSEGNGNDTQDEDTEVISPRTSKVPDDLSKVANVVRDIMVPESGQINNASLDEVVHDDSKSALVVNRKLYRAHSQLRLAVMDASKRFEDQQVRHAYQVIQRQQQEQASANEPQMSFAGLVMRHGNKQQVSSEAIRKLLEENRRKQLTMVEKANRRGGRGRR